MREEGTGERWRTERKAANRFKLKQAGAAEEEVEEDEMVVEIGRSTFGWR